MSAGYLPNHLLGAAIATGLAAIRQKHSRLAPRGECRTCDELRRTSELHFPPHDASARCESGKRPHCTCDVCF